MRYTRIDLQIDNGIQDDYGNENDTPYQLHHQECKSADKVLLDSLNEVLDKC